MEKTWKLVYASQEKEQRAMDTINALKEELINLSQLLDKSSHVGSDQEVLLDELRNQNAELENQLNQQAIQITDYERNIQLIQKLNSDLQAEKVNMLGSINELNNELDKKDKELTKVVKKRDKLQKGELYVHNNCNHMTTNFTICVASVYSNKLTLQFNTVYTKFVHIFVCIIIFICFNIT